jgi:glutathione peroxidase
MAQSIYDFRLPSITGTEVDFSQYRGKVLVFVNVASRCGYTGQYRDLEAFYQAYKDKGVVVLGFPSNNFGGQEPGSNEEIATFCSTTYGVSFPMFAKISVKGNEMHPLYQFLTRRQLNQSHDDFDITWNFNKVVVDRLGRVVHHFKSGVNPSETEFRQAIDALLH